MSHEAELGQSEMGLRVMDIFYVERMKIRLQNMRKVAMMSHDPRIVEIVTETAEQLEEDIRRLEAETTGPTGMGDSPPA